MNINVELNKIIEYIEDHLEEKIDYKEISSMIGINEYTFQKIFLVISNVSLPEYIRNRRLSNAGQELVLKNEKIIDVALKYQYNNATSFSRAFEKFHGIKPSQVRKNPDRLKMYTKLHFNESYQYNKKIEYKIVEREQIVIYGNCKITTNEKIKNDAPKFYIKNQIKYGKPPYGMVEYKDKERLNIKCYWVLYEKDLGQMQKWIIPEGKWIQIKVKSQDEKDIQKVSNMFYKEVLPICKYNFKFLPDMEFYHDGIVDFLVPIED